MAQAPKKPAPKRIHKPAVKKAVATTTAAASDLETVADLKAADPERNELAELLRLASYAPAFSQAKVRKDVLALDAIFAKPRGPEFKLSDFYNIVNELRTLYAGISDAISAEVNATCSRLAQYL